MSTLFISNIVKTSKKAQMDFISADTIRIVIAVIVGIVILVYLLTKMKEYIQ